MKSLTRKVTFLFLGAALLGNGACSQGKFSGGRTESNSASPAGAPKPNAGDTAAEGTSARSASERTETNTMESPKVPPAGNETLTSKVDGQVGQNLPVENPNTVGMPGIPTRPSFGTCTVPCRGPTKSFYNDKYKKHVLVVHCSADTYDILLAESAAGPYFKLADRNGGGEDHCELLNESLALESSATTARELAFPSAGCPTCKLQSSHVSVKEYMDKNGQTEYYSRSYFGEPFERLRLGDPAASTIQLHYTPCWYSCGVKF